MRKITIGITILFLLCLSFSSTLFLLLGLNIAKENVCKVTQITTTDYIACKAKKWQGVLDLIDLNKKY